MPILDKVFKVAVDNNASDIHIVPNEPYTVRRMGRLEKLKSPRLKPAQATHLIAELLTDRQKTKLKRDMQLDFAYEVKGVGRFRGSTMRHHRGLSAAFRAIPPKIPSFEELGLPEIAAKVLDNHQGVILVTGATGQGKSTTLAAMVDLINTTRAHHILTVEDPIEFIHPIKKGTINQRQLGRDTASYDNALKGALREDPDVIMIGELRDLDTISLAISAGETGHLVLGTMATSNAAKTVDRIIDAYPPDQQNQIRTMLGESLKAVIAQRLVPRADDSGMALAVEILIVNLSMGNLIKDGKTFQIPSMMETGKAAGMQTMDGSIMALLKDKVITVEAAVANANKKELFKGM